MINRFDQNVANHSNHAAMPFFPARMDSALTAKVLGFQEHDIPVLVQNGQLEPLGNPMPNSRKYFARVSVLEIADDVKWLSKATKIISQHWAGKNAARSRSEQGDEIPLAA